MWTRRQSLFTFVLLIAVIIMMPLACTRSANRAIANYSGDIDEAWAVRGNVNKRLGDYHEFEDLYQLVKGNKATLLMRINSGEQFKDLTQEVMIINDWVSRYNSRARQYDRNMWRSADLPTELKLIVTEEDLRN